MVEKLNNTLQCAGQCGKMKRKDKDFYISYNKFHSSGKIPYCKNCLKLMICNDNGSVSMDKLKQTMQLINRPFLYDLWKTSLDGGGDVFGNYMKNLSLQHNRLLTWENSQLESHNVSKLNYDTFFSASKNFEITEAIVCKWGAGYKLEEYESFERKYELLKNNYPEKTSMHTEALLKYIRYSVKEELSTAGNNVADAKSWGALAKDAATAARINPNQLAKADLQDGLTTFGQLSRVVEQAVDVIPILPKFKKQPQDEPDFTLWCFINYIRDMKDLPPCEYEDIYMFYEQRKKDYENRMANLLKHDDESESEEEEG